jgi:hypothetical protein
VRTCELRGHAGELGFIPRDQVRWLSPGELARTAVKVVLAAVFASYSDQREIQAALDSGLLRAPLREPDTATELWVDYVADLGDGFDATSTVAGHPAAARQAAPPDGDLRPRRCLSFPEPPSAGGTAAAAFGRADARMRDKVDPPLRFARAQVTYPDASTSRRLAYPWSVHWLGRRNPGFPQLAAGVHATLFVALSVLLGFALGTRHPIKAVRSGLDAVGGILGLGGLGVLLLLGWIKRWARTREANAPPSTRPSPCSCSSRWRSPSWS